LPAVTLYTQHGRIICETYYVCGQRHSEKGFAQIRYDDVGKIIHGSYFIQGAYCHNIAEYLEQYKKYIIKSVTP